MNKYKTGNARGTIYLLLFIVDACGREEMMLKKQSEARERGSGGSEWLYHTILRTLPLAGKITLIEASDIRIQNPYGTYLTSIPSAVVASSL